MSHHRMATLTLAGALASSACGGSPPPEVGPPTDGTGSNGSATTSETAASTSTTGPGTDASSGLGSGEGTSSSGLDSTGTGDGTTVAVEGGDASSEGTTGEVSTIGCADGTREALLDEVVHPTVAACAGGFWVPGVVAPVSTCGRQGGNDGPTPDGMGCSIEDLCASGWHLCASRHEVAMAGLGDCNAQAWGGQFFATGQSGNGANACADTGTNDVFGCGDVGYDNISGCAPLNRSTGNLCVNLPGAWTCSEDAYAEATHVTKPGPAVGGALCCRDGA
jgi:hypothetical protein